jgi:hypothetical protein
MGGTKPMTEHISRLKEIAQFINNIDDVMEKLYQCQGNVNYAYNHVDQWRDERYILTGCALIDTGNKIQEMNDWLVKIMMKVNEKYETLNREYFERNDWDARFRAKNLEVEVEVKEDVGAQVFAGTSAEGLRKFEQAMEEYIESTRKHLRSMRSELDQVHTTWRDENYKKIDTYVSEFEYNIGNNLTNMSNVFLPWVVERRRALEKFDADSL